MPITGNRYEFTDKCISGSPEEHGVYALFDGDELIYYGRAAGKDVTIRSRLRDHKDGYEGRCTQKATSYMREITESAKSREAGLLEEYEEKHGCLPRCNEVRP